MADYEVGDKKPPKHGQIKKGEVRNPRGAGAHKHGRVGCLVKKLTAQEVIHLGTLILQGDEKELSKIKKDSSASVLKKFIASCILKGLANGDTYVLDSLLNRFIGPVKQKVDHTSSDGSLSPTAPQIILTLPDNGRSIKEEMK